MVVAISVQQFGYKPVSVNSFDFTVIDERSVHYSPEIFADAPDTLKASEIVSGESISGTMVFQVPQTLVKYRLKWEPFTMFENYRIIYK